MLSIKGQRDEAQKIVTRAVTLMQHDHYRHSMAYYVCEAFKKYKNHLCESYHRYIDLEEARYRATQVTAELARLGFDVE